MQMFTDFRLQQQQKEMRAQNSLVDQTQAGGSDAREFDKERREKQEEDWKRLRVRQEAWSRGRAMQMRIGSVMKNLLIKVCFIWEQPSL